MDEKIYILENDLINTICVISLTSCAIAAVVLYGIDLFFRIIPERIMARAYQGKWIGKIEKLRLRTEALETSDNMRRFEIAKIAHEVYKLMADDEPTTTSELDEDTE